MKVRRKIAQPSLYQNSGKSPLRRVCFIIWMPILLTMGCVSSGSHIINLDNRDTGRSVVASIGDKIEVTLQTIGLGQYGDPIVSSGSVIFLGESSAGTPNPGGPRQLYRFDVVASGQADITIPHTDGRPEGPAIPAFTITVSVP